jgi:hypothetical protein
MGRDRAQDERNAQDRQALRGKDKANADDLSPAIRPENVGLNLREEIALGRENGKPYGLDMRAQTIMERIEGDPRAPARDEYLKRH